jgi:putative ABC transport system ATP-binding protein
MSSEVEPGVKALKAVGLEKWFGEGDARTHAVRDVSFEAEFGEMLYIVGPSGSGKTTLLSMISGILRPDAGSVAVAGKEIWKLGAGELADFRLNTVGFVFQDYHLFPRLTTAENVAIPLILQRKEWKEAMRIATEFLDVVGLSGKGSLPPVKLSGGEQQRVAIARALVGGPDILIFDEPTASLDGNTGRTILSFVRERFLNERRTILIVTHDSRIFEYADRMIHMEDGSFQGAEGGEGERIEE